MPLMAHFWLACMLGSAGVLVVGFASGFGLVVLPALSVALLAGLLVLEARLPIDHARGFRDDPQRWHDVGHLLVGSLAGEVIGNTLIITAAAGLAQLLSPGLRFWPHSWPVWAQAIVLLAAADFLEYWRHRMAHRLAWLWRVHALHHDADRMHALKSSRNHGLDLITRFLFVFSPLALIGVPPLWLPAYAGAILVVGPISHANLDLHVPKWLHRVVVTPHVHRLHHARARSLADSNFGPVTPLWDILFGTFRHPDTTDGGPTEFGIEGETCPTGFWAQLAAPFVPNAGDEPTDRISTPT